VVNRRALLSWLAAVPLLPHPGLAGQVTDLTWRDLLPQDAAYIPEVLLGVTDHSRMPTPADQPVSTGVRSDWDGQRVRLPGFIVPLEHQGTRVVSFMLVPFVGACVHVPPPPANQLVYVTTETPYDSRGMFESVRVTGTFSVSRIYTGIAEAGYVIAADRIEPV